MPATDDPPRPVTLIVPAPTARSVAVLAAYGARAVGGDRFELDDGALATALGLELAAAQPGFRAAPADRDASGALAAAGRVSELAARSGEPVEAYLGTLLNTAERAFPGLRLEAWLDGGAAQLARFVTVAEPVAVPLEECSLRVGRQLDPSAALGDELGVPIHYEPGMAGAARAEDHLHRELLGATVDVVSFRAAVQRAWLALSRRR